MVGASASTCYARTSLVPRGNTSFLGAIGGSSMSYANLVAYEAGIGG